MAKEPAFEDLYAALNTPNTVVAAHWGRGTRVGSRAVAIVARRLEEVT